MIDFKSCCLFFFLTKSELQKTQTHDQLSLFTSATEGSHLSLRWDLSSVTSGGHPQRSGELSRPLAEVLVLCLRVGVYDYHRLIEFQERLERKKNKTGINGFLSDATKFLIGKRILRRGKNTQKGVPGSLMQSIFWSVKSFFFFTCRMWKSNWITFQTIKKNQFLGAPSD